ncbi:malonate decarboxylase holo-[acyl-carrier-protein] synthase [Dyella sp. GSA-30]|uniref:malonate decarboxylase holo-[acyl-carrier-protein] synthase n=1 Tax=Dyella sp. GSA-30 TaxID=2994496 RepID=UPI0024928C74|nr:malonate decarboxylase holo-[acyl-carrier-protein] synthase [Dyella sp. GSA-30]BDU21418.1 phosphoribosyl-dephospho-CoA transferase [Dyella sp. GSA-30]
MHWHALRSDAPLQRHQLVRLKPASWSELLHARSDLAGEALLQGWADCGWPLIARRPLPGEAGGYALGLPLPPAAGKRRIAVNARHEDIDAVSSLPYLQETIHSAPAAWASSMDRLTMLAARHAIEARVFGSLAWQWLTGLTYLSPGSDLDVIWTLPPPGHIAPLLAELAEIETLAPMRLDGELIRADGSGVNWRELYAGSKELALKTPVDVQLCSYEAFVA